MKKQQTPLSPSAHARMLDAQGLTLDQIAEQTGLCVSKVKLALSRRPSRGRIGGNMSLAEQLKWASRLMQSAPTFEVCSAAEALHYELSCLENPLLKNQQGRG